MYSALLCVTEHKQADSHFTKAVKSLLKHTNPVHKSCFTFVLSVTWIFIKIKNSSKVNPETLTKKFPPHLLMLIPEGTRYPSFSVLQLSQSLLMQIRLCVFIVYDSSASTHMHTKCHCVVAEIVNTCLPA